MSTFKIFDIAASGMSAQSVRLNTTASNLANADTVSGDANAVYKARHPVFEAIKSAMSARPGAEPGAAVRVRGIMENPAAPEGRYEPGNPLANENGMIYSPNVNVIEEMTDMISASRAYQNNVEVMNTSKELLVATLKLGQS